MKTINYSEDEIKLENAWKQSQVLERMLGEATWAVFNDKLFAGKNVHKTIINHVSKIKEALEKLGKTIETVN